MKTFIIITIDEVDISDFLVSLKNPYDIIEYDVKNKTVSYKLYCTSLDEAFETGFSYGKRYKKKNIAQEVKKTRNNI